MSTQPLPCEVCGKDATVCITDLKEIAPDGRWRCFETKGPVHYWCDKHKRPPHHDLVPEHGPLLPHGVTEEYLMNLGEVYRRHGIKYGIF